MREADAELQIGAAQRGAVADALDLEALREASRDALDHVGDERPREAVEGPVFTALGRPGDEQLPVALFDLDPLGDLLSELSERAVNHHAPRGDRHRDS